jgi:hypothetical protein
VTKNATRQLLSASTNGFATILQPFQRAQLFFRQSPRFEVIYAWRIGLTPGQFVHGWSVVHKESHRIESALVLAHML